MKELVVLADSGCEDRGGKLSEHLNRPLVTQAEESSAAGEEALVLHVTEAGLLLESGGMSMKPDLSDMLSRLKPQNLQREMLVKAVRIKGVDPTEVRVLDATAGLGEDSLILAAAGFNMKLYELDPVIAALLMDAMKRAEDCSDLSDAVGRMELVEGDSIAAMRALAESAASAEAENAGVPDVVLLDPMFPARQKSGLIKKKFQLLQQLESPCADEEEMLSAALACGARKVVIKRPQKGPFLAGKKPDYSLDGKAIRYDCFVIAV